MHIRAGSVSRFLRERMRDITSDRFDLVNTSGIYAGIKRPLETGQTPWEAEPKLHQRTFHRDTK
jgi:hypothetical protein